MNKTKNDYQANLCEGFGSLSLIGQTEYELIKDKLMRFCSENQVQYAMAQGLLNRICAKFNDKRKNLNKCLSSVSVYKEGRTRVVVYRKGRFQYAVK